MISNDNLQWDDEADVKARHSAAIIASAEFRGRSDLLEIAVVSNAKIARWDREMLALNRARIATTTAEEWGHHRRQIKAVVDKMGVESRRFEAIFEAMNEETRDEFWRLVLPSDEPQR